MQVAALYIIHRQPTAVMGNIAGKLHCDASNVTGIVDRLVSQGLVVRKDCETDRRAKVLVTTQKGEATILRIMRDLPAQFGCDKLTEEERQHLHDVLVKVGGSQACIGIFTSVR